MNALFWDDKLLSPYNLDFMLTDTIVGNYDMGAVLDEGWVGHTGGDLGYSTSGDGH